jgi:hypothetical protein
VDEPQRIKLDGGREIRIEPVEERQPDEPRLRIMLVEHDGSEVSLSSVWLDSPGADGQRIVHLSFRRGRKRKSGEAE